MAFFCENDNGGWEDRGEVGLPISMESVDPSAVHARAMALGRAYSAPPAMRVGSPNIIELPGGRYPCEPTWRRDDQARHPEPATLRFADVEIDEDDLIPGEEVRHALGEDRLTLWYQPKIDVSTGALRGAEALLRLDHPRLGIVTPSYFLPRLAAAELAAVTSWVAERAISDWGRFAVGGLNVRLSINAPASALETSALPSLLEMLRPEHPAWPGLTVEMTESEIIRRVDLVRDAVARLSIQQVSISIDDFGSGYSSLVRLIEVPFSEIKIDRALVRQCAYDESIRIFLAAIRDFARYHEATVVAEGVETAAELDVIAEIGIDEAQGFYFARPMPADDFLRTGAGLA